MNSIKSGALLLLLLLLVIGCAQEPEQVVVTATTAATAEPTVAPTLPPPTNTPEPTGLPKPTITPEPTPIVPTIEVADQTVSEAGLVVVESMSIADPGWLVVYADSDGIPGMVLGYAAVSSDDGEAIEIAIDPYSATPTLYAGLHVDGGDIGDFEFPGTDTVIEYANEAVLDSFSVEIDLPVPAIGISDQTIPADGLVQVESVFTLAPGWLVIHTLADGSAGKALGQIPVGEGQNVDLAVPVRWREATAELVAVLHDDPEHPGGFNPASDMPVLQGGEPVMAQFAVKLPPDILAYDQPIVDGKLQIDRVVSEQPGWIVLYNAEEDKPNLIIGFEKVEEGINQMLEMEVVETAVTPLVFLQLHEETDIPSEFNFPIDDPLATYDGEFLEPTAVFTNPGNYLITTDQALGEENEVVVPLVVTDLDSWLVVYTETDEGQPDEIIGQLWLPAGVNHDNRVPITAGMAGERLLAALHQDSGAERHFNFPDGEDVELLRNREPIRSPFMLEERTNFNP